ncbi:MAG: EamA family transporter [Pseudomonadota bacterium]
MPPYGYAIASALLWALSVPVLNLGLSRLPPEKRAAIVPGLLTSMTAGLVVLGLLAFPIGAGQALTMETVLAGIFTYPIATGLYYLSGFAFGTRTEFAAQFAKIKPLFSALIAVLLLGETLNGLQAIPLALMVVGIALFYMGLLRQLYSRAAVTLGLLTALAWAIGEAFVKAAFTGGDTLDHAFVALAAGTALAWLLYPVGRVLGMPSVPLQGRWLWPFALHGILSFGLAYTLFFHSIATLGLYSTVLINAFWPFLSIWVVKATQALSGQGGRRPVPLTVWMASSSLLAASVIEIYLLS